MTDEKQDQKLLEQIEGLTAVKSSDLREFKQAMNKVIPDIVKIVEERRLRAAKSRHWQLKC